MRRKKVELDTSDLLSMIRQYQDNASLLYLAKQIGVSVPTMASYLRPHTKIRGRGRRRTKSK